MSSESSLNSPAYYDLVVIGGGAAGLFAAWTAALRGKSVIVLEHNKKFGLKILISGGGRCNFTNERVGKKNFLAQQPNFPRFVLDKFQPKQFIRLLQAKKIPFHEKKMGQLFCDRSSKDILNLLLDGCRAKGVKLQTGIHVKSLDKQDSFHVVSSEGVFHAESVLVATGGLSFPRLGATDFGYKVAKDFGHTLIKPEPALVPLTLKPADLKQTKELAGVSCPVLVKFQKQTFEDDLLFTHWGLSGPAILKISLYWHSGEPLHINLAPEVSFLDLFKEPGLRGQKISKLIEAYLPARAVQTWLSRLDIQDSQLVSEIPQKTLNKLAASLNDWTVIPEGTEGYKKAEVTRGGISLDEIHSRTLESKLVPGLFFAGEVLDVTGWLGGYNFQWAWASGYAVGQSC